MKEVRDNSVNSDLLRKCVKLSQDSHKILKWLQETVNQYSRLVRAWSV